MAMDPVSTPEAIAGSGKDQAPKLFSLLGTRRFLPLLLAQSLGAFNAAFLVGLLAAQLGPSPDARAALAFGVFIVPLIFFADIAGQVADKYEKAKLAKVLKALEIPVMGVAGLGIFLENEVLLLCALGLFSLLLAFFTPVRHAILPHHLAEEDLAGGNALLAVGTLLALLAGGRWVRCSRTRAVRRSCLRLAVLHLLRLGLWQAAASRTRLLRIRGLNFASIQSQGWRGAFASFVAIRLRSCH